MVSLSQGKSVLEKNLSICVNNRFKGDMNCISRA